MVNNVFRDVAIIFHAHCLSPFRFLADMLVRGRDHALWDANIAFPLERLHQLITEGVWSDPHSERLWKQTFQYPYQLWDQDPTSSPNVALKLHDVELVCPWCQRSGPINLTKFKLMHVKKTAVCRCTVCKRDFNAETLSAQYLKSDLRRFTEAWYIS
jgi:hypothetical protein